jgi:hypothetical protein
MAKTGRIRWNDFLRASVPTRNLSPAPSPARGGERIWKDDGMARFSIITSGIARLM